jgi:ankyrin repeat protein
MSGKLFRSGFPELADRKNLKDLSALIREGFDCSQRDRKGGTPLHYCLNAGAARLLIENGADVNAKDASGDTPMHLCGDLRTLHTLLERGAKVNAKNNAGDTPLLSRLMDGDDLAVWELTDAGANVSAKNKNGVSALLLCEDESLARKLLEAGAKAEIPPFLMRGDGADDFELLCDLVIRGANPDTTDERGNTPLHLFAMAADLTETLICGGADLDRRNAEGKTALHIYADNAQVVQMLLDGGADPAVKDDTGKTALDYCRNGVSAKLLRDALLKKPEIRYTLTSRAEKRRKEKLAEPARLIAEKGHKNQRRKYSGDPYITHPAAVVELLKKWRADDELTLATAWAHDLLEDTSVTAEEIAGSAGVRVMHNARLLTRPKNSPVPEYMERLAENAGVEVLLVKAADRICNTRDFIAAGQNDRARAYFSEAKPVFDRLKWLNHIFFAAKNANDDIELTQRSLAP